MAFSDWFRPKPAPIRQVQKLLAQSKQIEQNLIKRREVLLIEFEKRHPMLRKLLDEQFKLEKKARILAGAGNFAGAERINALIDMNEEKIKGSLTSNERFAWNNIRVTLHNVENQLKLMRSVRRT